MEKLYFGINDYDISCIKIYFSKSHVLIVKNLEEYDNLILQLQNMRNEIEENLNSEIL
jgi:hypothetical protein